MVKKWPKISSQKLGEYYIFNLYANEAKSPRTGQTRRFYQLDAPDWINIIPITDDGYVVFVHQYRHGTERVTVEIPAGMMDPEDESPMVAALRELREETGFEVGDVHHIGSVAPNPAFLNNMCHSFVAYGAKFSAETNLDSGEDIATELIPLADIPNLIKSGRITNALVIAAFYHYERFLETSA